MENKINAKELKKIIKEIIVEQATCDRSGPKWGRDMLNRLDKAIGGNGDEE